MSHNELAHLETLAQIDELTARVDSWARQPTVWRPLVRCQALLTRVLARVQTLRIRLEAPLVIATFGGTGTGKSSLVNALVGEECTRTGRERPTTRRPVLLAHPRTDLETLGLPLDQFEIVRRETEMLRDIVVLDCPDPDTSEEETPGSNLQRLHALLPYCDVLIYTSTQQKYRSARVAEELGQAASGCRLVFVQTHADLDEDIREDWRLHLREHYEVPDVFLVDSLRGLREQQAGQRPSGDLARLQDLLTAQLASSERVRVRRANVIDLLQGAVSRCRQWLGDDWPQLERLSAALEEQRRRLSREMSVRLRDELLRSRNLWERRLVTAVTESWGFSPFSALLRLMNGLGSLITSISLYRARNAAQLALIGVVQGTRWLKGKREEFSADATLARAGTFCLDDAELRETELVMEGHVRSAGIESAAGQTSLDDLRRRASAVEGEFLDDAGTRVDTIIADLAARNSRWHVRAVYELLLCAYLGFVLYRVGRNFFYDSWLRDVPLLATDFYIPAALFLVLWSGVLLMLFTRRLRRGLRARIETLASELVESQLSHGLFPQLDAACRRAHVARDELDALSHHVDALRSELAAPHLGGRRAAAAGAVITAQRR
jgi:hypothetical protein